MARKQHPECGACDKRWMVDIDTSGEYGVYRLYGCKQPIPRKFQGISKFGCAHYAGEPKEHLFTIIGDSNALDRG